MTPLKVVYGRDPPPIIKVGHGQTTVGSLEESLLERDFMSDELRINLLRAQQRMKDLADRKRRDEEFNVGDIVYLKLQPYRHKSLARRPFEKLAARFYGPFEITQRMGKVAYQLKFRKVKFTRFSYFSTQKGCWSHHNTTQSTRTAHS